MRLARLANLVSLVSLMGLVSLANTVSFVNFVGLVRWVASPLYAFYLKQENENAKIVDAKIACQTL